MIMTHHQEKVALDLADALEYIDNHTSKNDIIEWYKKGPPDNLGFIFYKCEKSYEKDMQNWVLNRGYDSSGYAMFHRFIQCEINKS